MRRRTYTLDSNGCLLANGSTDRDGYCRAWDSRRKKNTYAHRLAYEREFGDITDDKVVDHICRVRRCVNTDHLRLVTIADNTRFGNLAKLNWDIIVAIQESEAPQQELADTYNINQSQISRIKNGKAWVNQ